jgi:enoyl-CoA hydratase/carnithine racemase
MAFVTYEKKGKVGIITMNRPERMNAIGVELSTELNACIEALDKDKDCCAIILTGTGRAYCGGADVKEFAERNAGKNVPRIDPYIMRRISKPIIAAINGVATGRGMWELVLHTDIRVAAESAKLGMAEINRAIPVAPSFFMAQGIPYNIAMETSLTGELISAQRAYDFGIVNYIVPDKDLMPTAMKIAERIAELSPWAISYIKKLGSEDINKSEDFYGLRRSMADVDQDQHKHPDHKEAVDAFLQKRKPVWKS